MQLTHISIVDGLASIEDGAGAGDPCDIAATVQAYEDEVVAELKKQYPGVSVQYRWENSNRDWGIDFEGDYDLEDYDEIKADIQQVGEDVYQRGNFWVPDES
jgi:hypothetical protein